MWQQCCMPYSAANCNIYTMCIMNVLQLCSRSIILYNILRMPFKCLYKDAGIINNNYQINENNNNIYINANC